MQKQVCEVAAPYPVFNCSPLQIKAKSTPQYNRNQPQLQITTPALS